MNNEQLEAIRKRAEKATEGPWKYNETSFELDEIVDMDGETIFDIGTYTENDAKFIANAREDIPALLAEVERLRNELESIAKSINEYYENDEDDIPVNDLLGAIMEDAYEAIGGESQ